MWAVPFESWRFFSAESRVGGTFLAEAVKPKCGGVVSAVMQYGGTVLVVGGLSFFGGNDFGGRWYYQNMAVNRHITGTAHQGVNFTAGKIPTTTLQNRTVRCGAVKPHRTAPHRKKNRTVESLENNQYSINPPFFIPFQHSTCYGLVLHFG